MKPILLSVAIACPITLPAAAAVPDAYRQLWSDPVVTKRIDDNIERNRKGDMAIEVVGEDGRPVAGASLSVGQKTHAFLFGCNAFVLGQLDTPEKNARYEEAFVRIFNFATVPFYWEGTEPTKGELRYAEGSRDIWRRPPADRYPPFAKKYGVTLKGHPLLWHAYNPAWLPKDAAELKALYQKRFDEISTRYRDRIPIWDVVNESLVCKKEYPLYSDDRAYVAWAFKEAHQRFKPEALLMINEVTSVSHQAPPDSGYLRQIKELQKLGADVRGAGFQFHFFNEKSLQQYFAAATYAPAKMLDVYDAFAELGLPLFVTEITIPTPAEDGQAVQAEVVRNLYRLWFSAPRMAGITWWNLGDGTAVKGENVAKGGLLDEKLDPKDSYKALDRLINHDWKTTATLKTDAQGRGGFRGFYGKYAVSVAVGGTTQEFAVDLSKPGVGPQKLVMKQGK
jgi:GH35 family endo-1,4-beta-xylanase